MEYRHGPISVADERSLVWFLGVPPAGLLDDARRTGATVETAPGTDPLVDLVRVQRLAVDLAGSRGLDPDDRSTSPVRSSCGDPSEPDDLRGDCRRHRRYVDEGASSPERCRAARDRGADPGTLVPPTGAVLGGILAYAGELAGEAPR